MKRVTIGRVLGHWKPGTENWVKEKNIVVGEYAILQLPDKRVIKTSPVEKFSYSTKGLEIETRNSIYQMSP